MKFNISRDTLNEAVQIALKGISSTPTIPALSGILLTSFDDELDLRTATTESSVSLRVKADIVEHGQVVIPGKIFANIVKSLPDAIVKCELKDNKFLISCEKSRFKLNTIDPEAFLDFPELNITQKIELPVDVLLTMVNRVRKAASTDKNRAVLNGILMTVENNSLRLVATDSYRLAIADTKVETSTLDGVFETIVPSTVFYDALSIATTQSHILIGVTDSQIVFFIGDAIYVTRKIEGNYPKYRSLLPQDNSTAVVMNTTELHDALRRVSVINQSTLSVKFNINADSQSVTLSSEVQDQGMSEETINAEITGDSLEISFNYHYICDGLGSSKDCEDVTLELQGPMRQGVFKSYGPINYLYLVMPVRPE